MSQGRDGETWAILRDGVDDPLYSVVAREQGHQPLKPQPGYFVVDPAAERRHGPYVYVGEHSPLATAPDWRDERIAALEAELAARDSRIADLDGLLDAFRFVDEPTPPESTSAVGHNPFREFPSDRRRVGG